MEKLFDLIGTDSDKAMLMVVAVAGAFAVALVVFAIWSMLRAREDVRKRASDSVQAVSSGGPAAAVAGEPARHSIDVGKQAVDRLFKLVNQVFVESDQKRAQLLRRRLVQAGFFNNGAVTWFFGARLVMAAVFTFGALIALPMVFPALPGSWLGVCVATAAMLGYMSPGVALARRIAGRTQQIKTGFADYMDLMVVCAEAGLSMEASIERVSREIAAAYPALAENLYIASLEIRAGRTVTDALDRLAKRLGVDEARSFATLLQQSEELGSSVVESLKVYSDDMRNKRLMRAEEKAYALPAKLVVPLTLFIFPVLIVTLLLPVIVRVSTMM